MPCRRDSAALVLCALALGCAQGEPPVLSRSSGAPMASATSVAPTVASSVAGALASAPVVDLAGVAHPPEPPSGDPRLGAVAWVTRVHEKPRRHSDVLGWLRAGAVLAAGDAAGSADGCKSAWRAIAPRGWVCEDDASSDLAQPIVRAASRRPDFAHRLPYMYGVVTRGGPVYARLPSDKELRRYEPNLATHLDKWRSDPDNGARYGLDVWLRWTSRTDVPDALAALEQELTLDVPWYLKDGSQLPNLSGEIDGAEDVKLGQVDRRQGRSFIDSFLFEGRRYNVTPDLTLVPADRFRPIRGSDFHGWQVGQELRFPFALVRREGARKWMWSASKKAMVDQGELPYRSAVLLTNKQKFHDGVLHYETTDGFYVDDRHASRIDPAKRWPKWAQQGAKWIDINITKQVLVAYEGQTMVYATLISSGEAGLADHEGSTATIRGIFRIHTKHVSITMDSEDVGEEFELRDVPFVQYFKDGYALHGAYWHDRFGRPKSHGCINLAPEDARRLFFWTDPPLPTGWHGVRTSLDGTIVFIHA